MTFLRTIAMIVHRSLRLHALAAAVTVISVALGCGLMIAVNAIQTQTYNALTDSPHGFDAVLGARGSKLQLVLNSFYHIDQSTGNIPWSMYLDIKDEPAVRRAVPIAVGDNVRGFRMVGTTTGFFDPPPADTVGPDAKPLTLAPGSRLFDPTRREAVVGAFAARSLGLKPGTEIHSHHGLSEHSNQKHEHGYVVVGVLETSNTPADRAIFIPLEGYWRMEGHALYGAGERYVAQPGRPIPDKHKQVSAVLLGIHSAAGQRLDRAINIDSTDATLAWPTGQIIANLFDKVGWANRVLEMVAQIVMLVAAAAILAGLYNTMLQRQRQLAILRALGA
ncbi:MAG: ABC transporter permease, partial [Planctomycetota bacterium]